MDDDIAYGVKSDLRAYILHFFSVYIEELGTRVVSGSKFKTCTIDESLGSAPDLHMAGSDAVSKAEIDFCQGEKWMWEKKNKAQQSTDK